VNERAAQAVQRLCLRVFAVAADDNVAALDLEARAFRQFPAELAFGAFDGNFLALTSTLTFGGMAIGCFPIRDMSSLNC